MRFFFLNNSPSLLLNSLNSSVSCFCTKSFFLYQWQCLWICIKPLNWDYYEVYSSFLISLEMNLSRSLRGNFDSSQASGCLRFYITKYSNSPIWRERIWICLCVLTIPFSDYFWWLKEVNGLETSYFLFFPKTQNILPCNLKP